jgi:hypothetical protein
MRMRMDPHTGAVYDLSYLPASVGPGGKAYLVMQINGGSYIQVKEVTLTNLNFDFVILGSGRIVVGYETTAGQPPVKRFSKDGGYLWTDTP